MIVLLGLLLAWLALFGGYLIQGGQVGSLTNLPAASIVLGGTVAAGMIQADVATWRSAWQLFPTIFWQEKQDSYLVLTKISRWAQLARKQGPLSLDPESAKEPDAFLRLGLQLIVDGADEKHIQRSLKIVSESRENRWLNSAEFFENLGGYAPAMGIVASVLGLMQVMASSSDPQVLAQSIAVAFVAIIYGVALANLFLLPIAGRLRSQMIKRSQFEEMLLDGILAIQAGENPRILARRLQEYKV